MDAVRGADLIQLYKAGLLHDVTLCILTMRIVTSQSSRDMVHGPRYLESLLFGYWIAVKQSCHNQTY